MDDTDFRRLVAHYEHASRHEPRRFASTTAAMAAFGYAAIVGTFGISAMGLAWGLGQFAHGRVSYWRVMIVLGCASLLWSLARALWSRQTAPEGLRVTRNDAPRLFELIDKVRQRCGAKRPDVVLLDGELNAAIVQQPRLGLLGWHRDYLIVGLPLLMALDVKQLAAVVAHEFGHLHGAHGKLGAWVYRTRRSWWKLAEARERSRVGASFADSALALFFRYFFPRFNARAFVLSRQQEYEADRMAHKVAGTKAGAEGLISIGVQARFLDECFWPDVFKQADQSPEPKVLPYSAMRERLREALVHPQAEAWLRESLKRLADPTDTHPSLRDRLEFAEVAPRLPAPPAASAADALLRDSLDAWIARVDQRWQCDVAERWARYHRHWKAQRQLAQELADERAKDRLDPDDHLSWVRAVRQVDGAAASEVVLRQLLADHPGQPDARYALGLSLIGGDVAASPSVDEGAQLLRTLAEESHACSLAAGQRYEQWLEANERFAELKAWRERLRVLEQQSEAAWEALHDFDGSPQFAAAALSKRALRPVVDLLRREPAVGRAFLVRKSSAGTPSWRFCVLVIERARLIAQPDAQRWWAELRERIDLPCPFMVVDLAHPFWKDDKQAPLVRQILETRGALIYAGRRL
ncbi:M48 family metallopeptidase [Piscinibacter sp.]|jgi:Zn-dependent protease with chaperone function|uniref:M48 family metallopeptidase n=1 Tax=Piscinibacter sp. TaxID=1903157 RepID=UPI0035598C2D